MNTKISQLARQAYGEAEGPVLDVEIRELLMKEFDPTFVRFTELIIQECVTVMQGMLPSVSQLPADVVIDFAEKVFKERFGVK